jgi:rare lipoprotein A
VKPISTDRILYWGRYALLAGLVSGLSACSTKTREYPNDDYGPKTPVDVSQVPDAVPQNVPYSRYGNPDSYTVRGITYHVKRNAGGYREKGLASWYGLKFHGKRTSSGEPYDMYAMTAAHKTLPLPTWVRVTNLDNGKSVVVKVNDRGPFHAGRIIDLSYAAASKLGVLGHGTAPVEVVSITTERPGGDPGLDAQARNYPLWIQAGAFTSSENAHQLQQRLEKQAGIPGQVKTNHDLPNRVHRVWLGPVQDARQLEQITEQLPRWGIHQYHVVQ